MDQRASDNIVVNDRSTVDGATIEELTVDVGAVRVGVLDYGNHDRPTAVLTHGLADSAWSLHPLALALAPTHRVLSVDLRGHGRSERGPYTLPHLVGDLVGLCERLELVDPVLVGHSLGGQAVAQFCGLYPEWPRGAVLIEALGPPHRTLHRTDPAEHERQWTRTRIELVRRAARTRPLASLDEAIERFRRAHPLLDADRAAFIVGRNTYESDDGMRRWRHDPASRDWLAGHDSDRAEQRWQGITCPVQVVLGADAWDTFWSRKTSAVAADDLEGPMSEAETERRMANFADGRLAVVEGAGHMVHYDRPEVLERIVVDFLTTLTS